MRIRFFLLGLLALPLAASAGQTGADKALSRLAGTPYTELYDLDARVDLLEASIPADEVTYSPAVLADWDGSVDPGDVDAALDQLAERVTDQVDAGGLTYTPGVATDWDGDIDPGDLDDAVNQLAERVDDNENALAPLSNVVADLGTANNNINTLGSRMRNVTIDAAAEAGNAIVFSLTAVDGLGNAINVLGGETIWVEAYTDAAHSDAAVPASWTLTDGGNGSLVATSVTITKAKFQTTDTGSLQVAVTDVSGASGATLHLRWSYAAPTNVLIAQAPFYSFANFTP